MNSRPELKVRAQFGTLRDYFAAVTAETTSNAEIRLPTLSGDFFSYADRKDNYWTGRCPKQRGVLSGRHYP